MAVYKLINNGVVVNTIIADEVESIADQYDSIEEVIINESTPSKTYNSATIRNTLTFGEKVKWDNDATPNIVTAKTEFQLNKSAEETADILQSLVDAGDISAESMEKILA